MSSRLTITEQFQRNTVALISLAIAVTSLGYNTWRNEASEHNRNQRVISIEILLMLSELQQVILDRRYGKEEDGKSSLRRGWVMALTIRDISMIATGAVPDSADRLFEVWQRDSGSLGSSDDAKNRIESALEEIRRDTHDILRSLD